jgi:hypothetical protein
MVSTVSWPGAIVPLPAGHRDQLEAGRVGRCRLELLVGDAAVEPGDQQVGRPVGQGADADVDEAGGDLVGDVERVAAGCEHDLGPLRVRGRSHQGTLGVAAAGTAPRHHR